MQPLVEHFVHARVVTASCYSCYGYRFRVHNIHLYRFTLLYCWLLVDLVVIFTLLEFTHMMLNLIIVHLALTVLRAVLTFKSLKNSSVMYHNSYMLRIVMTVLVRYRCCMLIYTFAVLWQYQEMLNVVILTHITEPCWVGLILNFQIILFYPNYF